MREKEILLKSNSKGKRGGIRERGGRVENMSLKLQTNSTR